MKSKPQERSLQTSCQECQFAIYDDDERLGKVSGGTQTGCLAGRLETLKDYVVEAYNDDQSFYVIDCVCNMFRQKSWNAGRRDVKLAREEIEPRFSIIIDAESATVKDVKTTTKSLLDIDYDKGKIAVVFSIDPRESKKFRQAFIGSFNKLQKAGYRPQIVMSRKDKAEIESFRRGVGCSYFIKTVPGKKIPSDLMRDIDYALNEDMIRAVFFNRGNINVISFAAYAARAIDHATYQEFESSILIEAKEMELYSEI